ncbi:MAG TPA: M56 family metallopeptidase [Pirellulales bacterium]|jgi:beta-lactamase regulating signal transducer with metallopeptidase domain|nr:M56 family metallopeptidase [Pirellulales bacterium]
MTPHSANLAGLVFSQIWQVTIVAALAGAAAALFCRTRPRLAYLLGLVVLVKCWAPPLWSSPIGVFCQPARAAKETLPVRAEKPGPPQTAVERPAAQAAVADDGTLDVVDTAVTTGLRYDESSPDFSRVTWPVLLGCVWLLGAITLAAAALYQGWRWRIPLGRLRMPDDGPLASLTAELAGRLGLRRAPRVVISTAAAGPAVFGLLRPTIVLPASLVADAVEGRLQMVLAHEMIHIRRGDLFVGVFQWITQIVWWFHPLVWLTCRQLARERERCCDEEVLASLRCPPASYAQCLLDVLRSNRGTPLLPAFPGMRAVDVTRRRFEHIFRAPADAPRHTPAGYWLLAAILLCLVLPGAPRTSATPGERETARPKASSLRDAGQLPAPPVERDPSDSAPVQDSKENLATETLALADDAPPKEPAAADKANVEPRSELKQAIDRGVSFLKHEQQDDGKWLDDPVGYPGGITAVSTLALVRAGVKPKERCVQTAVEYLRRLKPARTYNTALQTMVFCAVDPKTDRKLIERNVQWLCDQQKTAGPKTGAWAYPEAEGDNSNTGFAMLALYEANQAGVKVPVAVWRLALDYWVGTQNSNGSWGYKPQTAGTGSMTAQGLFCVGAAMQVLDEQPADKPASEAVERAARWLGRNFDTHSNPGVRGGEGWLFYYLHAVAQAGRVTGRHEFGEHDWFLEGVLTLLAQQRPDGSWKGAGHAEDDPHLATSMALLFLARGGENAR